MTVQINDDNIPEGDEQFALTLQASSNGHVLVGSTTITIKDNDGGLQTTTHAPGTASGDGKASFQWAIREVVGFSRAVRRDQNEEKNGRK